jgi:prepilin-type N-terminal cleavage/methylation domain-containing protein
MKKQKGFTLIELLVVIAIIGILATIVMVSLNTARQKARDSRRISDARQVQLAAQMYYDTNGNYPQTLAAMVPNYISAAPTDPSNSGSYVYGYTPNANPATSYVFKAVLEATNTALASDVDGTVSGIDCADGSFYYCVQP